MTQRGPRHRRRATAIAGIAVVAAGLVCTAFIVRGLVGGRSTPAVAATAGASHTDTIERGDLRGTTPHSGRLGRLSGPTIASGVAGTVTALPESGTVIGPRAELYRVDDAPVVAFGGTLPQWRAFKDGMPNGPDVAQLETALREWGYLRGTADAHFDPRTASAVRAWQKDVGLERTGSIELGRIVFVPGELVIGDVAAVVGDRITPGQPVYATHRQDRAVTVDMPVGSPLAVPDATVSVRLPAGGTAAGHIGSVGAPKAGDDGRTTVPVQITFDDPSALGDLADASVTVDFVSGEAHDVLSVPVLALGAASGGGFVLDVVRQDGSTRSVPVTVGLFAGDRVEVSGDGIRAGQKVRVPGA